MTKTPPIQRDIPIYSCQTLDDVPTEQTRRVPRVDRESNRKPERETEREGSVGAVRAQDALLRGTRACECRPLGWGGRGPGGRTGMRARAAQSGCPGAGPPRGGTWGSSAALRGGTRTRSGRTLKEAFRAKEAPARRKCETSGTEKNARSGSYMRKHS